MSFHDFLVLLVIIASWFMGNVSANREHRKHDKKYPFRWCCPKPHCKFVAEAQTQPTMNWIIYKHSDVHEQFEEKLP